MNDHLRDLIEACAPLWAGEAEVVRTYFDSPSRGAETDRVWLKRQCFKEFYGSGYGEPEHGMLVEWGREIIALRPELDNGLDRHELLELVEAFYAEYHHYCLFADIYDALGPPGAPALTPRMCENWAEGKALDDFRRDIRNTHGALGEAAFAFTEGGYCTLYSVGAGLAGRGGIDDRIAAACQRVYDDEVEHMLRGVVGFGGLAPEETDWELAGELVAGQLRRRIVMRNGQFGNPVPERRIEEIFAGDIEPIAFDYSLADRAA
ncbi:MAG: hypothetical protein OXC28_26360 [Defluviicoccus sp.]|nr:hypothetical protein [Defluviicoccus sp.]